MNCNEINPQLSAYFDEELPDEQRRQIAAHLSECANCRQQLDALRSLSRLVRDTPVAPRAGLWERIAASRNSRSARGSGGRKQRAILVSLAIAASLMLAAWLIPRGIHSESHHREMGVVFDKFFDEYNRNPDTANKIFLVNYPSKQVTDAQLNKLLGGPSVSQFTTLVGCKLRERHLITMPCCQCVQSVYSRKVGPPLVVFEHTNPKPEWFAHQTVEEVPCPEGVVCKIDVDHGKASVLTLKVGNHFVTLAGANDVDEARAILREVGAGA